VAIATSLASSVIPTLSKSMARRDRSAALDSIGATIRFAMLIAIPSAVGMGALASPIMTLLFHGENRTASAMLMWGSGAVVFFSLSTVTNGILQGINHMRVPIVNGAISLGIHVVVLAVLLWGAGALGKDIGIYGVMAANIVFAVSMCVLNAVSIGRIMQYRQEIKKTFLLPLASSAIMGCAVWGLYRLLFLGTKNNLLSIAVSIVVGIFLYFIMLLILRCVDGNELATMPGGRVLAAFGRKLHLL